MIEGQTQQPGVGSGLAYNVLTEEQRAADSPELLAYWTWRKLAGLNWGNISGEIDTAIKHALLRWGAAAVDYVACESLLRPRSPAAPGSASLNRGSQCHYLKTWPAFYEEVARGWKPFECRKADRDFQTRDTLWLEEWNPEAKAYTGRRCAREVTYILRGPAFGVEAGWVVLGLATPNEALTDGGAGQ